MVRWGGTPTPIVLLARHSRLGQPARPVALDAARALVRCARSTGLPEPVGRGAGTASPTSSSRAWGLSAARRRATPCRRLPRGSPWVKLRSAAGAAEHLTAAAGRLAPCRARPPLGSLHSPCQPRCAAVLPSLLRCRLVCDPGRRRSSPQCQAHWAALHPVPVGCGFQAGIAAMSRFGTTCRGDELRKDGGNGEGPHRVRRPQRYRL